MLMAMPFVSHGATCFQSQPDGTLCNALPSLGGVPIDNVQDFVSASMVWLGSIIGTLALVMVIYSGARMVVSQGDPAAVGTAKKTLTYAILGLVVVLFAYVIVSALQFYLGVNSGLDATNPESVERNFFINPLRDTNLQDFVVNSVRDFLGIIGAVAILYIIISGFRFITSAGNEEQAKKGKAGLTWAIIGLIAVIMSYVIVQIVVNTFLQ